MDDPADDDDFADLLADFNMLDETDDFDAADGAFLDSISANLKEAAGIEASSQEADATLWQAPAAPGLANSGLAAEEAVASRHRRASATNIAIGDEAMWAELASASPLRQHVELKPEFPNTTGLRRQPSGRLHVTTSDNLLAALEAEAKRLVKSMSPGAAKAAAGGFDTLAAHARAAPRLDKPELQKTLDDVSATGEEGQGLLRLVVSRRQGLSPDGKKV